MKAFGLDLEHRRLSVFLVTFLLFIRQSCNAEADKKVCLGTNYKFVKQGTMEEHYSHLKEMYSGCEVVLGNMEIKEVGGYVLIAVNSVKTIPLVNLRIIRGNSLYKNSALYILSNFNENNIPYALEELPMRQLKEILQGGVMIARNPRLCNLDTIKWEDIVHSGNNIDIKQSSLSHCPTCMENCNGSCWGSGPENCQIFTKLICPQQCPGRCRGPNLSDCCHSQCAAGCTGPTETDCLACLQFLDGNTCLESCSWTNRYNLRKSLVEAGPKKYGFGSLCVKKCPYNYIASDSGSCVHAYGFDTHERVENNVYNFKKCDGLCEKDKQNYWNGYELPSINDVLKQHTYILTTRKESYNITSKLERPKLDVVNAISHRKVCTGTANHFNLIGPVENHYNYLKKIYQGCEIVLGNLEITYLQPNDDVSFFKDIQEVGGYVLIALNTVRSIPLVNLRVIRGETLFEDFSVTILSNFRRNKTDALEELPMRQLQEIINGGIKIRNNPKLCNLHTIKWEDIVHSNVSISVETSSYANCSECDTEACNGSCWGPGPENCQILTNLICDKTCPGRCRGPKPSDCCDHKCAAGCKGPKETDCLACKLVQDNHDKCLEFCPPLYTFNDTHPMESKIKGDSCVIKCPVNYLVTDSGTCVQKCHQGSFLVEEYGVLRCKECDGPCPEGKICDGIGYGKLQDAMAVNASNIDDFENCTTVLGGISIMKYTIFGDRYTNTSAMDPAKLNILRSIREITGYLLIQWWPENLSDLNIFENLEVIRGTPKLLWRHALVVVNVSISSLGLKSLKEVSDGDVTIKDNMDLCYSDTINWTKIYKTNQQKIKTKNKSKEECVAEGKMCDPSCSDDGCWGPGPSQCFSCHGKECVS